MKNPGDETTFPLFVDWLTPAHLGGGAVGRLGLTEAPGSIIRGRNLSLDVATLQASGARMVVTLLPDDELARLGIERLAAEVVAAGMEHRQLPIADYGVPTPLAVQELIDGMIGYLRKGEDVVVHCRAGLGRTGTVAAALLRRLGAEPGAAIAAVRAVRPGSVETRAQEAVVASITPLDPS